MAEGYSMLTFEAEASHYTTCGVVAACGDGLGTVHLARHLPSGTLVAIKRYDMEKAKDEALLIQNEIRLVRQLRHPHVLGMHAAFVAGAHVLAVHPLMAYGSCNDLIAMHFARGLPEQAIACILHDTLLGLEYIHRKGIVHRAMRASHILVSASGRAVITGLRYSCPIVEHGRWQRSLHSYPRCIARNLNWLSPEILEQNLQGYNEKSDLYSLGVTACELANGVVPFSDMPSTLMLTEKVRGCCPQLLDCSTLLPPDMTGVDCPPPGTLEDSLAGSTDFTATPGLHMDPQARGATYQTLPFCLWHVPHSPVCTKDAPRPGEDGDVGCGSNAGGTCGRGITAVQEYAEKRFSDAFHQLTELCLQRDPNLRPSAEKLLQHAFLKGARSKGGGGFSLAEMLQSVIPLGDRLVASHDDLTTLLATDRLAELDLDPDQWDF